jgi:two-component system nitrate/nitrite response regulator NarL
LKYTIGDYSRLFVATQKAKEIAMKDKIRVAILDDHQGIIDGYLYRLGSAQDIEVVATILFGEDLEEKLAKQPVDVLVLDVQIPTSLTNPNPYPILYMIPRLLELYPDMVVLVISMHTQRTLINAVMESGASGYIVKDDQATIRELPSVIRTVAGGSIYMSQYAYQELKRSKTGALLQPLSPRQLEALSMCATYPDASTDELSQMMNIANSTLRNLLSGAYLKMNVRSKAAAIAKARQLGLITPEKPSPDVRTFQGNSR